jgi:hypothetical protein
MMNEEEKTIAAKAGLARWLGIDNNNNNQKGYILLGDHSDCHVYRIPLDPKAIEARKRLMQIEIQNAPIRWELRRDRRKND